MSDAHKILENTLPYLYTAWRHVEHICECSTLFHRRENSAAVGFVEDFELSGVCAFALSLDGELLGSCREKWGRGICSRWYMGQMGRPGTGAIRQGVTAVKSKGVVKRIIRAAILGVYQSQLVVRLSQIIG